MVRLPSAGLTFKGLAPPFRFGRSALPTWGGVLALLLAAAFFVALPDWRLEQLVEASGLPRLLPLAQPPLGNTARLLLALVAGVLADAIAWSALYLLVGPGGMLYRDPAATPARPSRPSVRRADAHPDAPPRHPLTAAELGAPPPPVERGLPADLDQPLAAFDPAAIPDVPREPVRPVAPIVPPPTARLEPEPAPAPEPELEPEPEPAPLPRNEEPSPSIAALLERLERGARRRPRR